MPELPDVQVYVERLAALAVGQTLQRVRIASPFVLRTFDPPARTLEGRRVVGVERLGKRVVIETEGALFAVIHLMIAGRLRWGEQGAALPKRVGLFAVDFDSGSLVMTEASSKKRASLHVVATRTALEPFDRGGIEPLEATPEQFATALRRENRTLKRALTDPRLISGIGNAYSDEILFHAGLSPVRLTHQLGDEELRRLWSATQSTLREWLERTRREVGDGFPDKVTAFREGMAVHGRYRQPCPACGTPVQRIRFAENEVNYCPRCQTGGRLLADRGLSRLLGADWPRSIDELEERLGKGQ